MPAIIYVLMSLLVVLCASYALRVRSLHQKARTSTASDAAAQATLNFLRS
jgi:hypothetical protein